MDLGAATATWIASLPNQLLVFMALVIVAQVIVIVRLSRAVRHYADLNIATLKETIPAMEKMIASIERNTGAIEAMKDALNMERRR